MWNFRPTTYNCDIYTAFALLTAHLRIAANVYALVFEAATRSLGFLTNAASRWRKPASAPGRPWTPRSPRGGALHPCRASRPWPSIICT